MERDVDKINEELRECQKVWFEEICKPWIEKGGDKRMKNWTKKRYGEGAEYSFSQPFFTGLPKYEDTKKPLVMFVGQETNGWGDIDDFDIEESKKKWNIKNSQESTIEILDEKLTLNVNTSSFWKFIIELYQNKNLSFNICWNNTDKIHYTIKKTKTNKKRNDDIDCIKLYQEDEMSLNGKIPSLNMSLLEKEIEIIKPKLIIFLTGNSYRGSIKQALNIKSLGELSKEDPLVPIKKFKYNKTTCLLTYHPRYINFIPELKEKIIQKIEDEIKKL
jgi:hypothetical protein